MRYLLVSDLGVELTHETGPPECRIGNVERSVAKRAVEQSGHDFMGVGKTELDLLVFPGRRDLPVGQGVWHACITRCALALLARQELIAQGRFRCRYLLASGGNAKPPGFG